ncbi:MAG: SUMF1/EgtB/PvdO family nonheme iron enzyme, partial [Bacteroidales bacterium]|nr:SUMF1/EgtB/PvdO family nonheme iron enzyme [Bacteroidales bacterium]
CIEFCQKLSQKTGRAFTLPTEAQWEYAARGGHKRPGQTKYAGSNTLSAVAWYEEDFDSGSTHPVKGKQPNALGLYDMSGNVWEWCLDWYGGYSSASQTNPSGPASERIRVVRSSSWINGAWCCRVSYRSNFVPSYRADDGGLRLVLLP